MSFAAEAVLPGAVKCVRIASAFGLLMKLGKGKFAGSINGNKEIELADAVALK